MVRLAIGAKTKMSEWATSPKRLLANIEKTNKSRAKYTIKQKVMQTRKTDLFDSTSKV